MVAAGAEIVEVQIPFSDPIADGPTIMLANQHALNIGVTPPDCFEAIAQITKAVSVPILVMSYCNIPFSYEGGISAFCRRAAECGAQGLIIPDIPPEEDAREKLSEHAASNALYSVPLVSPLTTEKRMRLISNAAKDGGFVYCVSTTGTTGARKSLPADLASYIGRVRKYFHKPLALGFGISSPEQVREVGEFVEIAIVGSATIDVLRKSAPADQLGQVDRFIRQLYGKENR